MKRILLALCLILNTIQLSAQESQNADNEYVRLELTDFNSIDIDAPVRLSLIKLDEGGKPYLEYNTHGYYTSRFTATVDNKQKLSITERVDYKRESITDVKLYYTSLRKIQVARADVGSENTLTGQQLDIIVANESHFVANVDVLDLLVDISGKCRVMISGNTLYHTAEVVTAQYDASKLESVSTVITVSHNAMAKVDAHERLQATTATGGTLYYVSDPVILRTESSLFGGMISKM